MNYPKTHRRIALREIDLEGKNRVKKFLFPVGQGMSSDKTGFNILLLDKI